MMINLQASWNRQQQLSSKAKDFKTIIIIINIINIMTIVTIIKIKNDDDDDDDHHHNHHNHDEDGQPASLLTEHASIPIGKSLAIRIIILEPTQDPE